MPDTLAFSSFENPRPDSNVPRLFQLFDNIQDSTSKPMNNVPRLMVDPHGEFSNSSRDRGLSDSQHSSPFSSSPVPTSTPDRSLQAAIIPLQNHVPPNNTHPMVTRGKTGSLKPRVFLSECDLPSNFLTEVEPKSVKTVMADSRWLQAMKDEFLALQNNHTWNLVPANSDMNVAAPSPADARAIVIFTQN